MVKWFYDPDETILEIQEIIRSGSFRDKSEAVHALGTVQGRNEMVTPILLSVIREYLSGDKFDAKLTDLAGQAIASLREIKEPSVLSYLASLLSRDVSPSIQQRVLQYLCSVSEVSVIHVLKSYLQDPDAPFRDTAESALTKAISIREN